MIASCIPKKVGMAPPVTYNGVRPMKVLLALLIPLLARAQFSGLTTNDDGSVAYFANGIEPAWQRTAPPRQDLPRRFPPWEFPRRSCGIRLGSKTSLDLIADLGQALASLSGVAE